MRKPSSEVNSGRKDSHVSKQKHSRRKSRIIGMVPFDGSSKKYASLLSASARTRWRNINWSRFGDTSSEGSVIKKLSSDFSALDPIEVDPDDEFM